MRIKNNTRAMNSQRQLGITTGFLQKNTEKLSSGYRINRSADDVTGLSISEKMRRQIRGLTQASNNAQDGVGFCQIADGALNEVQDILKRCKELSVQASNGTLTDSDRGFLDQEVQQLVSEINRVHTATEFNEMSVFTFDGIPPRELPSASESSHIWQIKDSNIEIEWEVVDAIGNKIDVSESQEVGSVNSNNNSTMGEFVVKAAADAAYRLSQSFPTLFSAASTSDIKIGLNIAPLDGKGNVAASASLSMMSKGENVFMNYTMNVDLDDYKVSEFDSMTDAQKADLAATVAHEMTHLVMYDTITDSMLGGKDGFPKWFVEGMAQTASGDGGWVSYHLSPSSSDVDISKYMKQLKTMPYGAGYLATMSLGLAASGSTTASSGNIKAGLDKILSSVANKSKTFDEAIKEYTGYNGLSDFERKVINGDSDTLDLVKNILNARGSSGAGSLLSDLSTSQTNAFNPSNLNHTYSSYIVDKSNTKFSNAFGTDIDFNGIGGGNSGGGTGFFLQVGSEAGTHIWVNQYNICSSSLFDGPLDVSTQDLAEQTMELVNYADERVSKIRSYYGAMQNRLEHTIKNLDNVVENTTSAESLIRDTDMSKEIMDYSVRSLLVQAGQSMLAQANQSTQGVLALLQ